MRSRSIGRRNGGRNNRAVHRRVANVGDTKAERSFRISNGPEDRGVHRRWCGNTLRDRCHLAYTRNACTPRHRRKPVSGRSVRLVRPVDGIAATLKKIYVLRPVHKHRDLPDTISGARFPCVARFFTRPRGRVRGGTRARGERGSVTATVTRPPGKIPKPSYSIDKPISPSNSSAREIVCKCAIWWKRRREKTI